MKRSFLFIAQVIFVMIFIVNEADAANNNLCKTFRVVFENTITNIPQAVYANGEKIGIIDRSENVGGNSLVVFVCIDNKHSGKFEKNSVCYVSNDKMIVYNVWSTGVDLKEGESVRGFTGRLDLYAYEAIELLVFLRDAAMALLLDITGEVIGQGSVAKAKEILGVITK